ncbi:MAG: Xaa-Pro peptidase family protein [Chloroflexota bacterium]
MITEIPKSEFQERIKRIQKQLAERGLDALLTFGSEAEPQYVRYLADYWPAFETASVLVPVEGSPILIIGPESLTFARGRSKIDEIRRILEYRESSEPEYPGVTLDTFPSVFSEISKGKGVKNLGIAGYTVANVPVYTALQQAMTGGKIVRADDIVIEMRKIKSANEIALLRQSSKIAEKAVEAVLQNIMIGMREVEVVGIAQEVIYRNGAEYEGHPMYVLSGKFSTNAIGRPSLKKIEAGEVVQLNIGARFGGYASSVGRPICLGHMPSDVKGLLQTGLDASNMTMSLMKAGVIAKDVVNQVQGLIRERGYGSNILYGPCHGLGLMECEHPWMESNSDYILQENYTFQVDSFLQTKEYGARWEDGVRVTQDGVEKFSSYRRELIVI